MRHTHIVFESDAEGAILMRHILLWVSLVQSYDILV